MTIRYAVEPRLDWREMLDVFERSGLAARRPREPDRLKKMAENGNLVVTARDETGRMIGLSRSVTDFSYCCYLSDLAVDKVYQRRGIGRELVRRTHEAAGIESTLILLSAPAAMGFYPRIGMDHADNCFVIRRKEKARS